MANNYTQGATIVPAACFVPDGAKTAYALYQDLIENSDFYGLDVELDGDSLYISTGESFDEEAFICFIDAVQQHELLIKSFDMEFASYCDKLRPGEFGGSCVRVLPIGKSLWLNTNVSDLTDEQLRHLINVRERPSEYTSASDHP